MFHYQKIQPMKTFIIIISAFLLQGCAWQRIGQMTMISTRNVESKAEYKLIAKDVEGKSRTSQDDALSDAIDQAVKQYPEGEFMKNVVVRIKSNGRKIKVSGDVWGIPSVDKNISQTVNVNVEYKVGDLVTFKNDNGKLIEGTIIGQNSNAAVVEYKNSKQEVPYSQLTKIQRSENSELIYQVNSGILSVRSAPDSKSSLVRRISGGSKVEVIEKTNTEFWKIKYDGKTGYVLAKYLSK